MVQRVGLERGIGPANASTNSKGDSPDPFKTGHPHNRAVGRRRDCT